MSRTRLRVRLFSQGAAEWKAEVSWEDWGSVLWYGSVSIDEGEEPGEAAEDVKDGGDDGC